jgi:hypothetical protein
LEFLALQLVLMTRRLEKEKKEGKVINGYMPADRSEDKSRNGRGLMVVLR